MDRSGFWNPIFLSSFLLLLAGYHAANATPEAFWAGTELPRSATRRGLIAAAGPGVGPWVATPAMLDFFLDQRG